MAVSGTSGSGQVLSLDSLVRLGRAQRTPGTPGTAGVPHPPRRLVVPEGMQTPLGCDAVAVPARFGPLLMPRLPRVGCVYADETHWWWIVPSDSDYALRWPAPAHYATGAVLPDAPQTRPPRLVHRPDGTLPYTPPIPLYLALCRVAGATPAWSRPVSA
ncbi:hypothetical protein RKE30_30685 [Streptomyces sp. Li-HN-5-11]|uniref:hypothetical protein n=1 Tax=Streptomyces sp. Li-HN-5-11 TaxID=3075432 RepID=UPI0028A94462|nr:hypothetical protein [Streptomyces sp. Li-HN-5-11]WNM34423.1 hypothetical protein RKE30_30685 [Streptomyces sp. Li-HN-5-11]